MKEKHSPLDPTLTKDGKPRQRAPGAGAKVKGRDVPLGRTSKETHALLLEIKEARNLKTLSDAIELAAEIAKKVIDKKIPI